MQTSTVDFHRSAARDEQQDVKQVIACVDRSDHAGKVVRHACAVANALQLPTTLLQVLDTPPADDTRLDPIEWEIRRHESRSILRRLAETYSDSQDAIDAEVIEGQAAEEICRRARERSAELIVLGTHSEREAGEFGIGNTARDVLRRAEGNVLLVPVFTASAGTPRYRRILVPLDGSCRSECVLPLAVRLANAAGAELILVYIVPVPELIEANPLESEDLELRSRLIDRNERVARSYLDRVRGYVAGQGLKVRALTLRGDDIRSSLANLVGSERVGLVVLSARGHGGTHVSDVPYGNVAAYLITHSLVPTLIVRPSAPSGNGHSAMRREAVRPSVSSVI